MQKSTVYGHSVKESSCWYTRLAPIYCILTDMMVWYEGRVCWQQKQLSYQENTVLAKFLMQPMCVKYASTIDFDITHALNCECHRIQKQMHCMCLSKPLWGPWQQTNCHLLTCWSCIKCECHKDRKPTEVHVPPRDSWWHRLWRHRALLNSTCLIASRGNSVCYWFVLACP